MLSRRQRKQKSRKRPWLISAIIMAFVIAILSLRVLLIDESVPASVAYPRDEKRFHQIIPGWSEILSYGIPGFVSVTAPPPTVRVQPQITLRSLARGIMYFCTSIDVKDVSSLLRLEIPLIGSLGGKAPAVSALSLPNFPKFDWRGNTPAGKPLVAIYHTHTAESFIPSAGVAHRPGGQRGEIVDVGEALVKKLAELGVPSIQSKNIHDYPSFMKAYGPSEITAKKLLEDNPSIQMIFDIHRDADKRENVTAIVNGVPVAKITIVVGRGQQDFMQPHWQQNHAFAKLIDAKLNQHFPGMSSGIQLVEWRYNQHLHPRALLLEVGSQESSKEEAIRSIEMLAEVIAEILAES